MQELKTITVTNLTKVIKGLIDNEPLLSNVIVEGELSNFKYNQSGHLYFTLKDENAEISCVMFKSYKENLNFNPKDGDKVLCLGSVTLYEKAGRYQLYVVKMKEQGIGDLYKKYEELKKKLEVKGYFNKERKRPIPLFPKNIALLTSRTGAVIEDLKSIILKRSQFSNLTLYPMKVQGEDAKYDIVSKIEKANDNPDIDVIILARGGGSIEDLWPFNEEIVADAIYNSKKPIISAIGHETDFTISDFTADLRAATPSDAALIVVRDNKDLKNHLDQLTLRLNQAYVNNIRNLKSRVDELKNKSVFKDKDKLLIKQKQELLNLTNKLELLSPKNKLKQERESLDKLTSLLDINYKNYLDKNKHNYVVLNEKLALLNPLSVLDKGYSLTLKDEQIIKDINELKFGDKITTKLKKGKVVSIVKSLEE